MLPVELDGARRRYSPPHEIVLVPPCVGEGVQVPTLHAAGNISLLERTAVAVGGSRFASDEERKLGAAVARELVAMGLVVVSGLAAGIDGVAHRAAIAAGRRTIAVVGTPLERALPREHARLHEAIYRDHLVVSASSRGADLFGSGFDGLGAQLSIPPGTGPPS